MLYELAVMLLAGRRILACFLQALILEKTGYFAHG
jgi:hypothetical protein